MPDYIVNGTDLTSVANAIRTAGGTSGSLSFPNGWNAAIGKFGAINEVTITKDTTTINELLVEIAPDIPKYSRIVFWLKSTAVKNEHGRVMGGYAYKAGDTTFTGGFGRYDHGYSGVSGGTSELVAYTGDTFCWIGNIPAWS